MRCCVDHVAAAVGGEHAQRLSCCGPVAGGRAEGHGQQPNGGRLGEADEPLLGCAANLLRPGQGHGHARGQSGGIDACQQGDGAREQCFGAGREARQRVGAMLGHEAKTHGLEVVACGYALPMVPVLEDVLRCVFWPEVGQDALAFTRLPRDGLLVRHGDGRLDDGDFLGGP